MTRCMIAVALAAAVTVAADEGSGAVKGLTLQQLQVRAAALRVQINLTRAQNSQVTAEVNRLEGLVATEQAIVEADRSAADMQCESKCCDAVKQ
jgi:hypothetical protein